MRLAAALLRAPIRALRRGTLWWSIAMGALVALTVGFWPAFKGGSGISEAIDQLPAGIVQAFGLEDFGTPAGFLRGNLYEVLVPLLLACAAIAFVSGQTASEEANGRLEIFLAQPVGRRTQFLFRALAVGLALVAVVVVIGAVQFVTDAMVGLEIDRGRLLATIVLCGLLAFLHGAIAFAVAGWRGRPSLVLGVGIGITVAGYVVSALFKLSDTLAPWRHVSPWDWAFGGDPLVNGAEPWRFLALAVPGVAAVILGVMLVGRRDVAAA